MADKQRQRRSRSKAANGAGDDDDDTASAGHNSEARSGIIADVCTDLASIDKQVAALQATRRSIVQKRIKGDLGMKVADFNAAYRMSKLDKEDRDTMIDTLRECFGALGLGEQGSLFPKTEKSRRRRKSAQQQADDATA